ncbi:MAG TPA: prepilin-type N-terminal cleavage/methylation domain-containing protein [Thermoanaerobaculia bacterium]|nr:prepilin-type N-terminal cleavage/methylation domain-containing protein [Thermoanaerobaculia bacterium]
MEERARAAGRGDGQAGFTLLELLIALTLTVAVGVLLLEAFQANAILARSQLAVTELQQSLRVSLRDVARMVRGTGRGGLPRAVALEVAQNVPADTEIAGEAVVEGTDVLSLRGSFSSPIYRVDAADPTTFEIDGDTAQLVIDSTTRAGYSQPIDALRSLVDADLGTVRPEAILLVSRQSDDVYAVVELADLTFSEVPLVEGNDDVMVERATLTLNISDSAGERAAAYLGLSAGGTFPPGLTRVLYVSLIEEYRYFVRDEYSVLGDASTPPRPRLSRVRMVPGTDTFHPSAAGSVALADHVLDLQVALGIDLDGDGEIDEEDADGVPLASDDDEWQFSHPDDDLTLAWDSSPLRLLRLSLLGQTPTPQRLHVSAPIDAVENHPYDETTPTTAGEVRARSHRRWLLQGVVDLRNL